MKTILPHTCPKCRKSSRQEYLKSVGKKGYHEGKPCLIRRCTKCGFEVSSALPDFICWVGYHYSDVEAHKKEVDIRWDGAVSKSSLSTGWEEYGEKQ